MKRAIVWTSAALLVGVLAGCGSPSTAALDGRLQVGQSAIYSDAIQIALTGVIDPATPLHVGRHAPKGSRYIALLFQLGDRTSKADRLPVAEWATIMGTGGVSYRWTRAQPRECTDADAYVVVMPNVAAYTCVVFVLPNRTHVAKVVLSPPGHGTVDWIGPFVEAQALPRRVHVKYLSDGAFSSDAVISWDASIVFPYKHVRSYFCELDGSVSWANRDSCEIYGLTWGNAYIIDIYAVYGFRRSSVTHIRLVPE